MSLNLEMIVSLCKRRGFVFQSSEIYGGMTACYDYGPLGVELKRNVREAWWRSMVQERDDVEGIECSILMHPDVWKASGHVENFTDPLVDCRECKARSRADQIDSYTARYRVTGKLSTGDSEEEPREGILEVELGPQVPSDVIRPGFTQDKQVFSVVDRIEFVESPVPCQNCGNRTLTEPRFFNLLFRTHVGAIEDSSSTVFMRPETAQGMFVNYENVRGAMRRKLPFGIAQVGRSFRNEITTRQFIFRTLEFEQMEMEYFCEPGTDDEWFRHWVQERYNWYLRYGIRAGNLRLRKHDQDELAHYSSSCYDIEYQFPMGWGELEGIAHRGCYDLDCHMKQSGKDLQYFDQASNKKYLPHVIEPAAGVDRTALTFLMDAWNEEEVDGRMRTVLKFHPAIAPVKVAVLPLLKKKPEIVEICRRLTSDLKQYWKATYDDTAAIGKLYRRQDEIGTPFCVTVDVESLDDNRATVRERDSMSQERVDLDQISDYLRERIIMNPEKVTDPVAMDS